MLGGGGLLPATPERRPSASRHLVAPGTQLDIGVGRRPVEDEDDRLHLAPGKEVDELGAVGEDLAVYDQLGDDLDRLGRLISGVPHVGGDIAQLACYPDGADLVNGQRYGVALAHPQEDDGEGERDEDGDRDEEGGSLGCHSSAIGAQTASLPAAPPMAAGSPRSTTWWSTTGHGSPGSTPPKNSSIAAAVISAIR